MYKRLFLKQKKNDSNKIERFVTPKKTAKLRTSDNKDLFVSFNRKKIIDMKKKSIEQGD